MNDHNSGNNTSVIRTIMSSRRYANTIYNEMVKIIEKLGCWIEEKKKINPQIIMSRRYSTQFHMFI